MFSFTEIMLGQSFVEVISTEPRELQWICETVAGLRPGCVIEVNNNTISGEPYIVSLEQLEEDDVSMAWWLVKQFCQRGWKPMARTAIFEHGEGPQWSYFRLVKEQ